MKYRIIGTVSTTSSGVKVFLTRCLRASRRVFVDEAYRLLPCGGEPLGDIRTGLDELGGEGATAYESVGVGISQHVMGNDAGFDGCRDAELAHGRGIGLERIARIECARRHGIDVLAHVQLIDAVVTLLEPDRRERCFRHGDIGRAGRGHDLCAFKVLERRRIDIPCARRTAPSGTSGSGC